MPPLFFVDGSNHCYILVFTVKGDGVKKGEY